MTTRDNLETCLNDRQQALYETLLKLDTDKLPESVRNFPPSSTLADSCLNYAASFKRPFWVIDAGGRVQAGEADHVTYTRFGNVLMDLKAAMGLVHRFEEITTILDLIQNCQNVIFDVEIEMMMSCHT